MDGLHVVCGYAGAPGHSKAVQAHLNGINWSETLEEAGATTNVVSADHDPKGSPVLVLTAGILAGWFSIGSDPDASTNPRQRIAAGQTITMFAPAGTKVAWYPDDGEAADFPLGDPEFTIAAEDGDVINVAIQLTDLLGNDLESAAAIGAYLSDDADGSTLTATAPDGGVAVGAAGLAIPLIADKRFDLVTDATGAIDLDIEEAAAGTWYLVLVMPNGSLVVSGAITFAA
jgi:hypothetical protein